MKTLFDDTPISTESSGAVFSPCRVWRYQLWRMWDPSKPIIAFIGLNPSTADEVNPDPTITRCINFAKRDGFGRYIMLNIFAFRSTDPKGLRGTTDPVGPDNDATITKWVREAQTVVVAWGAHSHPLIKSRAKAVLDLVPHAKCLGLTKGGHPRHPLFLLADEPFVDYRNAEANHAVLMAGKAARERRK